MNYRFQVGFRDFAVHGQIKVVFRGYLLTCCYPHAAHLIGQPVVVGEHTIGIVFPNGIQVLHTSVLRGSPYTQLTGEISIPMCLSQIRLATPQDFNDYGINHECAAKMAA
jgi:hypothetical protein